jgi:hypothetical protein
MPTVTVYSKMRTSQEMRLYKTKSAKDPNGMKITSSVAVHKVIIQGITQYLLSQGKKVTLLNELAKTEVDKDLWDKIVAENGEGNTLLKNKQIFTAKSDTEAQMIAAEAPRFISDMLTREEFKKRIRQPKVNLI